VSFAGLQGKAAVVTGAGSGIGAASARRLSAEGVAIVLVDRSEEAVSEVAATLPGKSAVVVADVSDEAAVDAAFDSAVAEFGRIDLASVADFDAVVAVNLRGAFLGLKAAFAEFARHGGGGAVVLTASLAGLRGSPDIAPYVATKHGVVGLTKSAAVQGAACGVRVNAIAPGLIDTTMQAPLLDALGGGEAAVAALGATNPVGRMGTAEEVAALTAFLLSGEAPFVTGAVVTIDGGVDADNPMRIPTPTS
jgi:NAD(P)-dependent dehydrogenase (short-subunit alcohol dehydrogenase family)